MYHFVLTVSIKDDVDKKYGTCKKFPIIYKDDYYLVTGNGNTKPVNYHYCSTARMCGEELNSKRYRKINIYMESGRMMVLHSVLIGIGLYLVMIFALKQNPVVAENRSILIAAVVLIYMIVFGHGLPTTTNKNL